MNRFFNLGELADKGYSFELSIKDKDGNVVGRNVTPNSNLMSLNNDFQNDCPNTSNSEFAGELMMMMFEQMMSNHDAFRFKELDRIAFNDYGGMSTVFEWSYERSEEAKESMTQKDWNQGLLDEIDRAIFAIGIESPDRAMDEPMCIVVSPEVSAILDDYENFLISPEPQKVPIGRSSKDGKLVSSEAENYDSEVGIAVYRNPYIPVGKILVCYESDLNSGEIKRKVRTASIAVTNLLTTENFK